MHKTGWYIDLRIVFTHSFEHEIPNLVFNLVSLEKKFGAIVSWVLNKHRTSACNDHNWYWKHACVGIGSNCEDGDARPADSYKAEKRIIT